MDLWFLFLLYEAWGDLSNIQFYILNHLVKKAFVARSDFQRLRLQPLRRMFLQIPLWYYAETRRQLPLIRFEITALLLSRLEMRQRGASLES